MVVIFLIAWCLWTAESRRAIQPNPAAPSNANLHFGPDALRLAARHRPHVLFHWSLCSDDCVHSLLAMSGFETLAQVYRELEAPKLKNLQRASLVVYSL